MAWTLVNIVCALYDSGYDNDAEFTCIINEVFIAGLGVLRCPTRITACHMNGVILNRSVFSFLRTLTTWHCPHSPDIGAAPLCVVQACIQSMDISCRPDPQQQTCSSGFAAVCPCWDRRTQGRLRHINDGANAP